MRELNKIITNEMNQTRFGSIQFTLTMHDGEIRCINVVRCTRHNITPTKVKDIENGNSRKN